jgi:hypothetical protein
MLSGRELNEPADEAVIAKDLTKHRKRQMISPFTKP